jgi:hypothetical protein
LDRSGRWRNPRSHERSAPRVGYALWKLNRAEVDQPAAKFRSKIDRPLRRRTRSPSRMTFPAGKALPGVRRNIPSDLRLPTRNRWFVMQFLRGGRTQSKLVR